MTLGKHLALVEWTTSHEGYFHPDVELAFDIHKGYYAQVMTGRTIEADTLVARSSIKASLSVLNVLNITPFASHGTEFPTPFVSSQPFHTLQCFFLMEQWILQDKSWWAPYLATLPKPEEIEYIFFTEKDDDLVILRGTGLHSAIKQQHNKWEAQYAKGYSQLVSLGWQNAVNHKYTWELFRWACVLFSSRSFTSEVLSNTLPADKARPMGEIDPQHDLLLDLFEFGFPVLLPLLDLFNYRPLSRVLWQPSLNHVGLHMQESVKAGEEICNNYGPWDNTTLMLGYGFCIPANPFDRFVVGLKVPPGSPLAEARALMATAKNVETISMKEYHHHIFNWDHPQSKSATYLETAIFSQDLLDGVSVLTANFRELQTHTFRSKGFILGSNMERLRGRRRHRNLLQTIVQMRLECSARLEVMKANISESDDGLPSSVSQKQRYARLYRQSQLSMLETAVVLCRYCLLRAQTLDRHQPDLIALAADAEQIPKTSEGVHNLRVLIQRVPSVLQTGTLFTFPGAVSLLPDWLAARAFQAVNACVESVREHAKRASSPPWPTMSELDQKVGLMASLAIFRRVFSDGSLTSTRLDSWMTTLHKWFPIDDPFWDTPTEEFLPILDMLVKTAPKGHPIVDGLGVEEALSSYSVLCWAWNVQEQEGFYLDTIIGSSPRTFRIFIPKEMGSA